MSTTNPSHSLSDQQDSYLPAQIVLTGAQQEVHDQLLRYALAETRYPFAVFKGYAGVGKSTVTNRIVDSVQQRSSIRMGVAAPTHKAVKVLRKEAIPGVDYRTVHSWLGLKEIVDDATGEVSFKPDKSLKGQQPPIAGMEVLFHDETSMFSEALWHELVPWIKKGLRVIFIGDPAQIPPVKEHYCIPFHYGKEWGALVCELTEVMRQKAGNPILEYTTEVRLNHENANYQFRPKESTNERGEGVRILSPYSDAERQILKDLFSSEEFKADPDYMKVIAWQNKVVNQYNKTIRELIYGLTVPGMILGEKLITTRPYIIGTRTIIPNNEEVEIVELDQDKIEISYTDHVGVPDDETFKVYQATLKYQMINDSAQLEDRYASCLILHEDSTKAFWNMIKKLEDYALNAPMIMRGRMWAQKYKTLEKFAWVNYNYAITGHKSQGSTYTNSLVLQWDIMSNGEREYDPTLKRKKIIERNRILYVATSRAKQFEFIEP